MRNNPLDVVSLMVVLAPVAVSAQQRDGIPAGPGQIQRIGQEAREAVRVLDSIWMAPGVGNTFLITTREGGAVTCFKGSETPGNAG